MISKLLVCRLGLTIQIKLTRWIYVLQIRHGLKSASILVCNFFFKRWRISYVCWKRIPCLRSTACNNIGYKLSFLVVEIQRLKIFEVIRSLSKQEKIVSYWGDSPSTILYNFLATCWTWTPFWRIVFSFDISKLSQKELF